ncbi:L-rhamnose mutarotase [Propionibacteriaceae bacterium Y2011]
MPDQPDLTDQRPGWVDDGNQECFVYHLKPGAGEEYDRWHAETLPGVIAGLQRRGAYDYSIFRRGDLVITTVRRLPGAPEIDAPGKDSPDEVRWSELMAPLFERTTDEDGRPLKAARVFRMD